MSSTPFPRLNPSSTEPLYRQLARGIREGIAEGALKPGARIPSVAALAKKFHVNPATVVAAFQELERAGLIVSHVGRGTFVAEPSAAAGGGESAAGSRPRVRDGFPPGLSGLLAIERPKGTLNLSSGVPDTSGIGDAALERWVREALGRGARRLLEFGGPAGLPELRAAIAAWMGREGHKVDADQVIVTNGSQQAASLLACWAREEGRSVFCETPTFVGIPGAFVLAGHGVQSVRWEGDALDLARLPQGRSLLYCCPDHHNPTGRSLSPTARREVASWAGEGDAVVVVDEVFRGLRFRGDEPPSLYGMLPAGRRVLVSSISKTFLSGLRVGFLVADRPLVAELLPYKRYLDLGGPALTQAVAAAFLARGYEEHLKRVRTVYRERAEAAIEALKRGMPDGASFTRPEGSFHLWVTLPPGAGAIQIYLRALERGVSISPGPAHDIEGRYQNCFRLSYAQATPAEIREGVSRLATVIRELSPVEATVGLGMAL